MMYLKSIITTVFCVLFLTFSEAQEQMSADSYGAAEQFLWWNTNKLVDGMARPQWIGEDRLAFSTLEQGERIYVIYNAKNKKRQTFNDREQFIEALSLPKKTRAKRTEILSPDGKMIAFIKDWNLWIRMVDSDQEVQLTFDGIENFGYATDNAGWRKSERPILLWSPDSKKIATFQQDQRHVSDMYMIKTNVGAPELSQWKYPLPSDEDIIRIHRVIIDVESKRIVRLDMDPDPRRGSLCDDISCDGNFDDNQWSSDGRTLIFVSNSRDHKIAQCRMADTQTGAVKDIFKEEVPTQYESGQGAINWKYLEKSNEILWYSERDNWGHLYLYDATTGNLKHQITKGDFVVTRVLHVDEKKQRIYFEANGREADVDPYFSHLYCVDFSGENLKLLTPEPSHHQVRFSSDYKYFVDVRSTPTSPPVMTLRKANGQKVDEILKADISRLKDAGWKEPIPIQTKSADGQFDLYGLMFTPTEIKAGDKFPVINYIYPGPQGGGVGSRSFSAARSDHQALAQLGFVVIVIDGSCNPGRSKAFHDACYGDMSINTLPDQMAGIRQLAKKYDFIDVDKVGVWGHSGGGFATAAAMFKYPDFYDVGISESGNHDNRNYEDDWGERYNGLMVELGDGKTNYELQANQLYAENLKGKLMIAHGGMDDNVPVSNSLLVVDALIKANKDFDLIIFPNAGHGFGEDSAYMMRKRWDYFVQHLQGKTPPKEFEFKK